MGSGRRIPNSLFWPLDVQANKKKVKRKKATQRSNMKKESKWVGGQGACLEILGSSRPGNSDLRPPWTDSLLTLLTAADADCQRLEVRNWLQGCTEAMHLGLFSYKLTGSWSLSSEPMVLLLVVRKLDWAVGAC